MANDNLSGTWHYLVQNADSNNSCIQLPKDLEDWIEFPQTRISDADPQSFWNNALPFNPELNCFSLEGLNAYAKAGIIMTIHNAQEPWQRFLTSTTLSLLGTTPHWIYPN